MAAVGGELREYQEGLYYRRWETTEPMEEDQRDRLGTRIVEIAVRHASHLKPPSQSDSGT